MPNQDAHQSKYHLFPKGSQKPGGGGGVPLDPTQALALVASGTQERQRGYGARRGFACSEAPSTSSKHRQIAIPELTSLEAAIEEPMDSPTIPGRPPLHERSISAPGCSSPPHANSVTFLNIDDDDDDDDDDDKKEANETKRLISEKNYTSRPKSPPRRPLPPPPSRSASRTHQHRESRGEPYFGNQPSASNENITHDKYNAQPHEQVSNLNSRNTRKGSQDSTKTTAAPEAHMPTPQRCHKTQTRRSPSEPSIPPAPVRPGRLVRSQTTGPPEQNQLPIQTSIMDRGRPAKKTSDTRNKHSRKETGDRILFETSMERKAFEELPEGHRPGVVANIINVHDLALLQKQAYAQAERFEVLQQSDVESLARELRNLDERTEYVRRTYTSLRAGRRNLQSRICQYLRSCHIAGFNYPAILQHEEALAELDASIDEWATRLEKSENRSLRVRQKLLEHVAAAAILPPSDSWTGGDCAVSLQQTIGAIQPCVTGDLSTPPRSPADQSPSPPLSRPLLNAPSPDRVVARVPSTILEKGSTKTNTLASTNSVCPPFLNRADLESIRVYAGNGLYSLLANADDRVTRLSGSVDEAAAGQALPELRRRELGRQKSQELLTGSNGRRAAGHLARRPSQAVGVVRPAPTMEARHMYETELDQNHI